MQVTFKDLTAPGESTSIEITVTPSDGTDGAIVVFIDTNFEPDGSDEVNQPIRVYVNDDAVYEGTPHVAREDDQPERPAEAEYFGAPGYRAQED